MPARWAIRLGGISGILHLAIVLSTLFITNTPDLPEPGPSVQEVDMYYNEWGNVIVANNGVGVIFSGFFFLWFLGMLHAVLRSVEGEGGGLSTVALTGGLLYMTLGMAGSAAEIVYPATLTSFTNFQPDAQLAFLALQLSWWLYRFCLVGMSVLIAAASVLALQTTILPRWLAWAGLVLAALALMAFLTPLFPLALLWVLVVSVLMLAGYVSPSRLATRS